MSVADPAVVTTGTEWVDGVCGIADAVYLGHGGGGRRGRADNVAGERRHHVRKGRSGGVKAVLLRGAGVGSDRQSTPLIQACWIGERPAAGGVLADFKGHQLSSLAVGQRRTGDVAGERKLLHASQRAIKNGRG